MAARSDPTVTELLQAVRAGDDGAPDRLAASIYDELRRLAASYMRRERPDHTLQPTALVHEAFMRLIGTENTAWEDRAHFFAVASQVMRRILVDHARRSRTLKRDHGYGVTLDDSVPDPATTSLDVLRVNDALTALAAIDPRQARIVEMRFFVGLTIDETAEVLGISPATVSREWTLARAWLHSDLSRD
ncbi:MAG: sigma-70 family RNA polymerase sigma factor [Gemmatimonadota bacterium]|nr:sigma-70 family RNA polymerase sigma factor [Gemmatimonadota bacterium]